MVARDLDLPYSPAHAVLSIRTAARPQRPEHAKDFPMLATTRKDTIENIIRLLNDPRLFREQAYIGGKWRSAETGAVCPVTNPSTGAVIGTVPNLGVKETRTAIDAAAAAFPAWRALLPQQRAALIRRWYDLIIENAEDLAVLMTAEQGKPLAEARGEIQYAASFVEWFAEESKRVNVEGVTPHLPDCAMTVRREPVGVTAAVTPWNFPSAMITRKAAAALAAGCPMVVRPANETPFSALALAELGERAGLPAGFSRWSPVIRRPSSANCAPTRWCAR